jgi:hypothetical protein
MGRLGASTDRIARARDRVRKAATQAGIPLAEVQLALGGPRPRPAAKADAWDGRKPPTVDQIAREFTTQLAGAGMPVDLDDLRSERVLRAFSAPRAVAMAVIRDVLKDAVTLAAIGEYFGRDHSTVVAALNRNKAGAFAEHRAIVAAAKRTVAKFRRGK